MWDFQGNMVGKWTNEPCSEVDEVVNHFWVLTHWTTDIRMYHPQYACSSVCLPPIELVLRVFSNHTALAIFGGFLDDREALNHGVFL